MTRNFTVLPDVAEPGPRGLSAVPLCMILPLAPPATDARSAEPPGSPRASIDLPWSFLLPQFGSIVQPLATSCGPSAWRRQSLLAANCSGHSLRPDHVPLAVREDIRCSRRRIAVTRRHRALLVHLDKGIGISYR